MTPCRDWGALTAPEMAALDASTTVAVLPLAAIEQHGPHLPLATDTILCDGILDAACDRLSGRGTVLRLPTQTVGLSPEHAGFPGTLTVPAETLISLWTHIGLSVAAAGIRKVILFNAHGGQTSLVDIVAQRLRRDAGLLVARASYFRFGLPPDVGSDHERRHGLHGGLVETALMLRLRPALVRREHVADFPSRAPAVEGRCAVLEVEGRTGLAWLAEDLNPLGATGNAAAADAALGERLLSFYAETLAALIEDVVRLDPWPPR